MESLKRFVEPEDIHNPKLILWVGGLGLVVNLLGLVLFAEHGSHGHSHGGGGHGHSHGGGGGGGQSQKKSGRGHNTSVESHGTHSHLARFGSPTHFGVLLKMNWLTLDIKFHDR